MPADSAHINLCKTIMSSVALGYPMPILLNWKGEFNRPQWYLSGSHIAKLESWLSAMDELIENDADAHDDDLALMVDAYDIWFQLPPSILIKRYHQLNREADERVRKQWGAASANSNSDKKAGNFFPVQPPKQSIIVTSAKHCSPDSESGSSPHYEHWPQSPMSKDMYGRGTDERARPFMDPARKYRKIRPRCVNSGMIMGTMGSLRAALRRVREKVDETARMGRQLWSDQALLGEVIGDQELWREWMLDLGETWNGTASDSKLSQLHRDVRPIARDAMAGKNFEFGIGLDYNFTTIPATCSSEEDGEFLRLNNQDEVDFASHAAGVIGPSRIQGVPKDLQEITKEAANSKGPTGPLDTVSWGNVSLYTDLYFGTVPVGIHHNAYVNGLKPYRLAHWWDKTWFYPKLRHLVMSHLSAPPNTGRPLAKMPAMHPDGNGIVYVAPESTNSGTKSVTAYLAKTAFAPAKFEPVSWDGVCQKGSKPWYDDLFADSIGPLTL
jgi:hypothetical protein